MTGSKRERDLAQAKQERLAARREAERAAKIRRLRLAGLIAGVVIILGVVAVIVWPRGGDDTAAGASPAPVTPTEVISAGASPSPPQVIDPATPYEITLDTSAGALVIRTDSAEAPQTSNSMVWLAEQGYFDGTPCHRLTTGGIFVLQCGDPTGTGRSGPGYVVPDENLPTAGTDNYPAGTVAMANAGAGTAGSQFFIVYADTTLPPAYTIWGELVGGLDAVKAIAAAGVQGGGSDGPPADPVEIRTATVVPSTS